MKYGLISDIHADIEALEQAIDLLNSKHVYRILCMGDLVERGPFGDAVAEKIRAENIICIAGNHDLTAEDNLNWYQRNAEQYDLDLEGRMLTPETLRYLKILPKTLVIPVGDQAILMAHGTPWDETTYVFPGSRAALYQRLVNYTRNSNAQILLLGHTHVPMKALIDGVHILNPGSVAGAYTGGSRTCAVLSLPEVDFKVYDIESGLLTRPSQPILDEIEG